MILRVCAILFLTACGPRHPGLESGVVEGIPNGTWGKSGADRHPIAGIWRTQCLQAGASSMQVEARVFDDRTLIIGFYFHDSQCAVPNFEQALVVDGQPRPSGESQWALEAGERQIRDLLLAPNSSEAARSMTSTRGCERSEWKVNRARSVYGSSCFAKGTPIGTYRFRRGRDPSWLEIRLPNAERGLWMFSRL